MTAHYIHSVEEYKKTKKDLEDIYVMCADGRKIFIPCANIFLVKRDLIKANTYNPNNMPDTKKRSLQESILLAGFAYPVTTIYDDDLELFVIVDGFHRNLIAGYDFLGMEYVPITMLNLDISDRMMATILFNKARGFHQVDLDADVIRSLIEQGLTEEEISNKLGIELETVHRYKQLTGIAELFKNQNYSMSWEMKEIEND